MGRIKLVLATDFTSADYKIGTPFLKYSSLHTIVPYRFYPFNVGLGKGYAPLSYDI